MTSPDPTPATLGADAANRLAEFSRTCKAAARTVSLYPEGHPAIAVSLTRLEQTAARMTQDGPYSIQVQAEDLLIDGAHMAKPDSAVSELAALFHRHLVGRLTLNSGANAELWRTLMLLLVRAPDDIRADGGIAKLWATAGGPSLELVEIDYLEVLREKRGLAVTIGIVDHEFVVADTPLAKTSAGMKDLIERFLVNKVERLSFERGVNPEEIVDLMLGLAKLSTKGANTAPVWSFPHIRVGRITSEEPGKGGITSDMAAICRLYSTAVSAAEAVWESAAAGGRPDVPTALNAVEGLADAVT